MADICNKLKSDVNIRLWSPVSIMQRRVNQLGMIAIVNSGCLKCLPDQHQAFWWAPPSLPSKAYKNRTSRGVQLTVHSGC
jgi:hypothetical protein